MDKDPRYIAFLVLLYWHKADHTLDRALETHSDTINNLSKKDKSLCNALIFGVLRHRESIDWIIKAFSNTAIEKIKPKPLYLLRLALYQILHLDRVPVFAAINTAVEIGKQKCGQQTAGFINAVLRKAVKGHATVPIPNKDSLPAQFISVQYSLPLWLAKKWVHSFGLKQTESLCIQINTIPMITLRTNSLKIDRLNLAGHLCNQVQNIIPTDYAKQGLRFTNPKIAIPEMEPFKQGWFQIQDEAAQMVTEFLNPKPFETILDACAGLGGKTGHIAQLMENTGTLIALDIQPDKLKLLNNEAQRLGFTNIQTKACDLIKTSIKDFDNFFDRVLVDAPCTGLGVLQRNPDTKWKRSQHDITRLSGRQKKILNAAANLVKPGGILVYAVCSCEPEENEQVIDTFLNKRKDFSIAKDAESDNYSIFMTSDGFLKTYPETNNMDGFFAARLTRKS
ncbi:MAG: 16S rRNA (cytosine(967)-C(5))-methyltransferase RsmB [Pseudomonadota bacterium]